MARLPTTVPSGALVAGTLVAATLAGSALLAGAKPLAQALARARKARALHPRGRTFRATVDTTGLDGGYHVALLDRPGGYRALARLSRGAGLPEGWPDVLGIAVRVFDGAGPGRDLDLLVSTTVAGAPLARHVPFPRRRLSSQYTTIAGYATRRGRRYLAVLPDPSAADLGTRFDTVNLATTLGRASLLLAVAAPLGRWQVFGRLTLGESLPAEADARLGFDPVVHGDPGLRPDGALQRLRAAAYRGSRAGRGMDMAGPPHPTTVR